MPPLKADTFCADSSQESGQILHTGESPSPLLGVFYEVGRIYYVDMKSHDSRTCPRGALVLGTRLACRPEHVMEAQDDS